MVRLEVETPEGSRQGSGFFVMEGGRLLTNYHVVRNAQHIQIKLPSGDVYQRTAVLAVDQRRDIAVLQVPGFSLPALPLGNSDSVRVGTDVVAIGTPLGLENTVTTGIVSGWRTEEEGYRLLQISAPAAQGSSGGPVLSRNGEVIGIAVSQMQGGENMNFAVPINYARGLLAHADTTQSLALLRSGSRARTGTAVARPPEENEVNRGLRFEVSGFSGFTVMLEGRGSDGRQEKRRVTYRRIEAVGETVPRIERYVERELTKRTGPFQTRQTVRRERSRLLVRASDLQPLSAQGRVAWWSGGEWKQFEYQLSFEGDEVTGTIQDTAGQSRMIERELPRGVLLRGSLNLAFATLASDSLVGESIEFTAFDASSGEIGRVRYDIREAESLEVGERTFPALRVNVASGLTNTTSVYRRRPPRVLLRRQTEGSVPLKAQEVQFFGRQDAGS